MYVCPGDLEKKGNSPAAAANTRAAIRRVQYSQHAWVDEQDCEAGECPFEEDALSSSGLVAYSGLFSHAHYPRASSLWVCPCRHFHPRGVHVPHACTPCSHGRAW